MLVMKRKPDFPSHSHSHSLSSQSLSSGKTELDVSGKDDNGRRKLRGGDDNGRRKLMKYMFLMLVRI